MPYYYYYVSLFHLIDLKSTQSDTLELELKENERNEHT